MLKKIGVEKLLKRSDGKEILGKLQQRYWKETLQPSDPRFKHVYGAQIKRQEEQKRKNEDIAADMRERRDWEKKQRNR